MCGGIDDVRCGSKWYVKSVFIIHVGGTRCVTSSTDHIMKIHGSLLTVECIRTCIFFILIVCLNTLTSRIKTNVFFDLTDFQVLVG
jgi:hypothetical protein